MACPGQPTEHSEANTSVFTGLEPVRLRPGMYVGSTDAQGLFTLLFELVTESLTEAAAGRGREVRVALRADGSAEVSDDGRPMAEVEWAFTRFGHGERGDVEPYRTRTGLHDIGYPVANALSERLSATARTPGSTYHHSWRRGVTHAAIQMGGPPDARGLTVAFKPDPDIFGAATFDATAIRERLQQLAFQHSGVRITLTDEVAGTRDEFEYADGVRACVAFLNDGRAPLHAEPILIRGEERGVRYEIGLQWCEGEEVRVSFANHYRTPRGGTHERGLLAGVTAGLGDFLREHVPQSVAPRGEYLRAGLTSVVSVWLPEPYFEGATRERLNNPEAETVVKAAARRGVCGYFTAHPEVAERVIRAAVADRAAHEAMKGDRKKQ